MRFGERECSVCGARMGTWSYEVCAACVIEGPDGPGPPPPWDHESLTGAEGLQLLLKLGQGGMGEVYLARQREPDRPVAVKFLREELVGPGFLRRFRRELDNLSAMDHPGIAKIYYASRLPDGRPFFVMEFIDGDPLDGFCALLGVPLRERLRMFLSICDAVHHAHQRGVIHRDLKPSNILVTNREGIATPVLIDFGIARAIEEPIGDGSFASAVTGTPGYMSPEQTFPGAPFDTRTDVWALGVVLFELLTDRLPFGEKETSRMDPPLPSQFAREPAAVRGDLDAIVLKSLSREMDRRYSSAAELAADVRRHLRSEPVLARPATAAYVTGRFLSRHRIGASAVAAILLILLGSLAALSLQNRRVTRALSKADEEAANANAVFDFTLGVFARATPLHADAAAVTVREAVDRGRDQVAHDLADRPLVQARVMTGLAHVYVGLGNYREAARLLQSSVDIYRSSHHDRSDGLATSLRTLGAVENFSGHYAVARPALEEALSIWEGNHGTDDPGVAEFCTELGHAAWGSGDTRGAREYYEKALELYLRNRGADDPIVGSRLQDLGDVAWSEADYVAAEDYYRRALGLFDRVHADRGMRAGIVWNNLAGMLVEQRHYDDALEPATRALELGEARQGPDHPELAATHNILGRVLAERGDLPSAETHFERALELSLGLGDRPEHAGALCGLAHVRFAKGQFRWSESLAREAIADYARRDPGSSDRFDATLVLGRSECALGRLDEGRRHLDEALRGRIEAFGEDHPLAAEVRDAIAALDATSPPPTPKAPASSRSPRRTR